MNGFVQKNPVTRNTVNIQEPAAADSLAVFRIDNEPEQLFRPFSKVYYRSDTVVEIRNYQ